jgi:hypothetical protein
VAEAHWHCPAPRSRTNKVKGGGRMDAIHWGKMNKLGE